MAPRASVASTTPRDPRRARHSATPRRRASARETRDDRASARRVEPTTRESDERRRERVERDPSRAVIFEILNSRLSSASIARTTTGDAEKTTRKRRTRIGGKDGRDAGAVEEERGDGDARRERKRGRERGAGEEKVEERRA
jgi:hypothetical protein